MRLDTQYAWTAANQAYLMAAIAQVRSRIEESAGNVQSIERAFAELDGDLGHSAFLDSPPAIEQLRAELELSSFERAVLLACAGVELDAAFARSCAEAQHQQSPNPTFALLLAAFQDAHWDAVSPAGPLRQWRLIEVGAGSTLVTSPLRIDERILHFLTGTSYLDQRLDGLLCSIHDPGQLPASQLDVARYGADLWAAHANQGRILLELNGADQHTRQAVAVNTCRIAGLPVLRISATALPARHGENYALTRLIDRECILATSAVLLDASTEDAHDPERLSAVRLFADSLHAPLIVAAPQRIGGYLRESAYLEVGKPRTDEQRRAWHAILGPLAASLNGHVDALVEQFNLTEEQIRLSALHAAPAQTGGDTFDAIWNACRVQARPQLDGLAQRVETSTGWDGLVLPEPQMETLRAISSQVRNRWHVYHSWGFAKSSLRGLGITALFAGVSGTGKTTAAEVLAYELKLDLYRIDLSQVVSKYIGETEKSLRRIFDAAEDGGSLLFFDEADALFGKRTEVKDSHDRYANIEVSYLLQRMEQYRGLAVLATNMKQALDAAFLRRIRFVVHFPFPDAAMREQIWRRALPSEAPTEGVDMKQLARLCVAGGNIRNIALGAAFLAVKAGQPIRMLHLLESARSEYLKIEKPLTEAEIRGWV